MSYFAPLILSLILLLPVAAQSSEPAYACQENGGQIAFSTFGLKLLDTATGEVRTLAETGEGLLIGGFAWSADGTRIAFDSNRGGSWGIHVVEVSESGAAVTDPAPLFDSPDTFETILAWSEDGNYLAVNIDGSLNIVSLDSGDSYDLAVNSYSVVWSQDELLYVINGTTDWTLWSVDASSGEQTVITTGQGAAFPSSISPTGVLLLAVNDNSSSLLISAFDTLSGEMTGLETRGYSPIWAPDGNRFAYLVGMTGLGNELIIMSADDQTSSIVTEDFAPDVVSEPAWAFDGRHVAFNAHGSEYEHGGEIRVLDTSTHEIQIFVEAPLTDVSPRWRPCMAE